MKHKVTVQVEVKKNFLGIPYKTIEKRSIMVDGKTYRKMKKDSLSVKLSDDELFLAAAYIDFEEEIADRFGE